MKHYQMVKTRTSSMVMISRIHQITFKICSRLMGSRASIKSKILLRCSDIHGQDGKIFYLKLEMCLVLLKRIQMTCKQIPHMLMIILGKLLFPFKCSDTSLCRSSCKMVSKRNDLAFLITLVMRLRSDERRVGKAR